MREHLYRGKRVDNGDWVYGNLVETREEYSNDIVYAIIEKTAEHRYCGEYADSGWHKVFPETISEYIGRTDDSGNKIFEGDILDDRDNEPHYVIVFDNGCFKVPSISEYKKEDFYTETADEFCFSVANVIGNIYDNTELLENKR